MKRIIKHTVLFAVIVTATGFTSTGCTVWENENTEIHPLPQTEIPVTPAPWEPGSEEENPVFD